MRVQVRKPWIGISLYREGPPGMSLKRKAFSGVAWSSIATIGERASVFLIMLVLVRLLDVKEFGTATTAVMIITILWPVARFGSYNYVIQHEKPDQAVLTGALMATCAFAVSCSAALFLLAEPLALAFSDPVLEPAIELLSPIFVIKALGTVQEAMLTKAFGFRALAVRRLAGVLAGGSAAIACALGGLGLYALIVQQLVMATFGTLTMAWNYRWTLDFAGGRKHVRQVWSMGVRYTTAQMLSSVNLSGFGLIIGFLLGTTEAGLFRLAFSAVDLCTQLTIMPFVNVAVPLFARLRGDREKLREGYLRIVQVTSLCTFIIFAWMAVMGADIGRVMYGARFDAAAPLIPVFCFAVFAGTSNRLIDAMLGSTGKPGSQVVMSTVQSLCAILLAVVSAPFGLFYSAIGHVARTWLTTPLSYYFLWRETGVTWRETLGTIVWPVIAAGVGVAPVVAIRNAAFFEDLPILVRLASTSMLAGLTYGLFLIAARPSLIVEMLQTATPKLAAKLLRSSAIRAILRVRKDQSGPLTGP